MTFLRSIVQLEEASCTQWFDDLDGGLQWVGKKYPMLLLKLLRARLPSPTVLHVGDRDDARVWSMAPASFSEINGGWYVAILPMTIDDQCHVLFPPLTQSPSPTCIYPTRQHTYSSDMTINL